MGYLKEYKNWLLSDYFDEKTKEELQKIEDDEAEIEDRFYKDLEFGTGGLRGKIGAGTNRINKYTVRKATQGLANYIINYIDGGKEKGVVVAYDTRHYSQEFAREVGKVMAGNGIKTYLFSEICPVPLLSFAVRELEAATGVVITASHNPPEYNGYKVYGEDGGQVVPEKARKITAEIEEIDDFSLVKTLSEKEARDQDLLVSIGKEVKEKYFDEILKVLPDTQLPAESDDFSILYTPLHGTGYRPVTELLEKLGFSFSVVAEQAEPDPEFSTVDSPNPENFSAFELALKKAKKSNPDLIMGTDPDCDRLGVVVKDDSGQYMALTGNEAGVLMLDYLLNRLELPENAVVIKTIVTTEMARVIAEDFNVELQEVLTGFKYIGEKIEEYKQQGDREFIFGFEESYGYLAGTYTRDKDGVEAAALFALMALYHRQQGSSVVGRLQELKEKYGYFEESLESIYMEGKQGRQQIEKLLNVLREEKSEQIAGQNVVSLSDYREGLKVNNKTGKKVELKLPQSDVLQYFLEDDSVITIRPSGTEPKLKIYFSVREKSALGASDKIEKLEETFMQEIKDMLENI